MCGIIGYIGSKNCVPILLEGLKRMEYRGYDSAGIAILSNNDLIVNKVKGKVSNLKDQISKENYFSTIGIGHTRWATHGIPNEINAHPHIDTNQELAVVHNGIIENYQTLKKYLEKKGHKFRTETDSEILAHLFEEYYEGNLFEAVRTSLLKVEGAYGIAVISKNNPDELIVARKGSPLLIAKGENEYFVASDPAAVIRYTNNIIFLEEGEIAKINLKSNIIISDIENNLPIEKEYTKIDVDLEQIEKKGYDHFMLKEINEQPQTILNSIRGRLKFDEGTSFLGGLNDHLHILNNAKRIILTACGTSWHSALIGEYLIETLAGIPVEVEYASEFRYRNPIIEKDTIVFVISQSGETADTLAALREAKRKGAHVFGICNVVGSTIARETEAGVYLHAGPEIGVASTKAFTSQVMVLTLIALLLGRNKKLSINEGIDLINEIQKLPDKINQILNSSNKIKELTFKYNNMNNALFLGRQINHPVALEGALKLKEISYIHAEGYPAAEMKHGPIALIDKNMPCIVIANNGILYDKLISTIQEIKARNGKVIVIANETNKEIQNIVDDVIYVPETNHLLSPLINVIPLQLLSYYAAVNRNCDIDKPRNLAKSVTVE